MLSINKWFKVTTYPENEEKLSDAINEFNIAVESETYSTPNDEFDYSTKGATRFTLECRIDPDEFDRFVEHLKEVFVDSWARLTY